MTTPAVTIWLTGLPASGKTTIASLLAVKLRCQNRAVVILDGDDLRRKVSPDLGFSDEDRYTQALRTSGIAHILNVAGVCAIVALVSPSFNARHAARGRIIRFFEVYLDCPVNVCQMRDTKGLYRRALAGEIADFTGVTAVYEVPKYPELWLKTDLFSVEESVDAILEELKAWQSRELR